MEARPRPEDCAGALFGRLLGGLLVCGTLESHSSTREGVGKELGDCSMVVACRRTAKIVVVKVLFERSHSF